MSRWHQKIISMKQAFFQFNLELGESSYNLRRDIDIQIVLNSLGLSAVPSREQFSYKEVQYHVRGETVSYEQLNSTNRTIPYKIPEEIWSYGREPEDVLR